MVRVTLSTSGAAQVERRPRSWRLQYTESSEPSNSAGGRKACPGQPNLSIRFSRLQSHDGRVIVLVDFVLACIDIDGHELAVVFGAQGWLHSSVEDLATENNEFIARMMRFARGHMESLDGLTGSALQGPPHTFEANYLIMQARKHQDRQARSAICMLAPPPIKADRLLPT